MATDKEIAFLSRVAANHLFLGQFEPLRASLLSLRKRHPELASSFLRTIVSQGGHVSGVHWSSSCPSPSHLAWLASLELTDSESNQLQVEFLILMQSVLFKVSEESETSELDERCINVLNKLLNLGLKRLKEEEIDDISEEELSFLFGVIVKYAEIFDAICENIIKQIQEPRSSDKSIECIVKIQKTVQLAHLGAIKECLQKNDINGAFTHIPFLHLDLGVEEEMYKDVLRELIMKCNYESSLYEETWLESRKKLSLIYAGLLQSSPNRLINMIQLIQDELLSEEIKQHNISESIPLPLKKLLETSSLKIKNDINDSTSVLSGFCMGDLYHYSRVLNKHELEVILETALFLISNEEIEKASDVVSLFPLLYPLIAVLGWDLLSGKITLRRKLMNIFWKNKLNILKSERLGLHDTQNTQVSLVDHLCDLLCYRLDVAKYVASQKKSLFISENNKILSENHDSDVIDPFVENLLIERLNFQTPLRVIFDMVANIRFKDAIKFIESQPVFSNSEVQKRWRDMELVHMCYAIDTAVFSINLIERNYNENENNFHTAMSYLKEMQSHLDAIKDTSRKVFMVSIISSLLQTDHISIQKPYIQNPENEIPENENLENKNPVISFLRTLLKTLRNSLPDSSQEPVHALNTGPSHEPVHALNAGPSYEPVHALNAGPSSAVNQALEWRFSIVRNSVGDFEWRLTLLQRLNPLFGQIWSWKDALVILRDPPSKLLNLCMKMGEYDIGDDIINRFKLSPENKFSLQLARYISSSSRKKDLDVSAYKAQLGPLTTSLIFIDGAVTTAKSRDTCKLLLDQAKKLLSEINIKKNPKVGPTYWDQIQETVLISLAKTAIQCLQELLEIEPSRSIQDALNKDATISSNDNNKFGQNERALVLLHQMIDDAFKGKTQFLNGKLHNIARVITDEDSDGNNNNNNKGEPSDKKGVILGIGFKTLKPGFKPAAKTGISIPDFSKNLKIKETGNRIFTSIPIKPSTYLSNFIIYIATVGDIFDGVDTTHDFNYFSLIYECPKDLLTHLVFERKATDAAEKAAEIMNIDFVHSIISSCVPPVFVPKSSQGWASMPLLNTNNNNNNNNNNDTDNGISPSSDASFKSAFAVLEKPLYPLQLGVVKQLGNLSPVRAVLACVFGSSILSGDTETTEWSFYEFALEQSERFPTLNRWIQMQSNLHRVSESTNVTPKNGSVRKKGKTHLKRAREPEPETGTGTDVVPNIENLSPKASEAGDFDPTVLISFDWENEGPYETAVKRLINEGKLMDALAVSDRCLKNGASDKLLQLLIEESGQENNISDNSGSATWQYCLRLRDKHLASQLALKYLHKWELDAAIDVLTMCISHLPENDPLWNEVHEKSQALQRYKHILTADDRHTNWQEVEAACREDGEGLALRLASKGCVSAALEVAETSSLSSSFRRELQGRQLVKLLTTDPLSGGGPASASRFLSSLTDSDDALPVAVGAMSLLPDLRSKQLLVHFFLKKKVGNLSEGDLERLNSWELGLKVLALLPLPQQQKCSNLHEHPRLILEVLLMMKQLQSASLVLKEFPSMRDDNLILSYAKKSISVNVTSVPRENRVFKSSSRIKQKKLGPTGQSPKPSIKQSIDNLQKKAFSSFSWVSHDNTGTSTPGKTGTSTPSKEELRKRKSPNFGSPERAPLEENEGHERAPILSVSEEWVLTGDPLKDNETRSAHKYDSSPDITLFKALLSLCSEESVAAKGALELCINQMQIVLSSRYLPPDSSMEIISRAYHATEAYVQGLTYARTELRKLCESGYISSSSEMGYTASSETTASSKTGNQDELADLLGRADVWLGRAELLQSLLGSGISASLEELGDRDSCVKLRDRLVNEERYSMAIYTCKKCKIDAFPVWNAWGRALIRMEHFAQARVKFKQAMQLYKDDITPAVLDIINTVESGPPVDVSSVRSMYEHLAKSAATILDDSLSADAYLNILYMPSTFPRSERSRRSMSRSTTSASVNEIDQGPRTNLDAVRYAECIHYLQEYAKSEILPFMFKHGHYSEACSLFLNSPVQSAQQLEASSSFTQRTDSQKADSLATEYGSIEDLCDLCIDYGAMSALKDNIISNIEELSAQQYVNAVLVRVCNYCETRKHFNYLYDFLVIKGDHVAAGLCCIQLFMNSMSQEEALKHLSNARMHFEEALSKPSEATRMVSKLVRGKSGTEKMTNETIVKFLPRITFQMDIVKAINNAEGPQWKTSLFGNPNDPETFKRRCMVVETLAEKHFDLAFRVLHDFHLPSVDIYVGVMANLAERKRGRDIHEFLKNIKGTIGEDDLDQVISAGVSIYVNKHRERPDKLVEMITSSHRKILAYVICGRLKAAFNAASASGSVADVQYVAHHALKSNSAAIVELCSNWLEQYM